MNSLGEGEHGSHWGRAEVAELEVGPGGGRGLAQQQDGEQQQQQETQDTCGNQRMPRDPGGVAGQCLGQGPGEAMCPDD